MYDEIGDVPGAASNDRLVMSPWFEGPAIDLLPLPLLLASSSRWTGDLCACGVDAPD